MNIRSIVARFRAVATCSPERVAMIDLNQSFTYGELLKASAAVAAGVSSRVQGSTLALLMPNTPAFAPVFFGALWAGKTVAILPTLAPPPVLKMLAAEVGAELVLTADEFVDRLAEAGVPCWVPETTVPVDVNEVPMQSLAQPTAVMLYTSGTTGRPKAVELSEENLLSNVDGCIAATGFDDDQVMLASLPFFHSYGLTVTLLLPLVTGAKVIIPERFIPRAILQMIERHRITWLVAVPNQFRVLAKESAEVDASSLWLCISGAERLPDYVAREFEARFGRCIMQGYGTTELSPVVSLNLPSLNRSGSVGHALPNLHVTIRDGRGGVLAAGESGEVCVEGPSVMLGYHRDPQATAAKVRNGVLYTGDRGLIDADGFIYIRGRADDLVKVSGEKVYPSEVESAIEMLPQVEESAVIAIPDEKHGARLHAFVLLKQGAAIGEAELRAAVREMLEPHKVPRTISFVEQIPRTLSGKTDRRALATGIR